MMKKDERMRFIVPAGVLAMACRQRRPDATRETPTVIAARDQLTPRERQVRPDGVTERPVVLKKPINVGGGKGPQLKTKAGSNEGPRDW
jgi:hypothetical protein